MPQTASLGRLISPQHVDRLLILLSYLGSLWYQGLVFLRAVAAVSNELGIFIYLVFFTPARRQSELRLIVKLLKKRKRFCFDGTIPHHTQIVVTVFQKPRAALRRRHVAEKAVVFEGSTTRYCDVPRGICGYFSRMVPVGK